MDNNTKDVILAVIVAVGLIVYFMSITQSWPWQNKDK